MDPSRFRETQTSALWDHWEKREASGLTPLIFLKVAKEDLPKANARKQRTANKSRAVVSDSEDEEDKELDEDMDKASNVDAHDQQDDGEIHGSPSSDRVSAAGE
jgi:hypothetical protein